MQTSKLLIIVFSVLLTPTNSDTNLPYFSPKYRLTSIYLTVTQRHKKTDAEGKDLISFPPEVSSIHLSDLP